MGRSILYLLILPLFLSGAAALAAELCWLRLLSVSLGGSSAALNIVLITFMGGLGLGAYVSSKITRLKKNYLVVYAVLEFLICIYLYFSPSILAAVNSLGESIFLSMGFESFWTQVSRFVLASIALLIPTTAMGMTTPLLITLTSQRIQDSGFNTALLYAGNTLGAASGALITAVYLVYEIGVNSSLQIASSFNLLAGILTVLIIVLSGLRYTSGYTEEIHDKGDSFALTARIKFLLLLASLSGFITMSLEVVLARFLLFTIGGSYYSHAIIISGFLIGIVSGAAFSAQLLKRGTDRSKSLAFYFSLFGASIFLTSILFGYVPAFMQSTFVESAFLDLSPLMIKMLAVIAVSALPAFCSGLIFPIIVHLVCKESNNVKLGASRTFYINTIGNILGVALTAFLFFEIFGVRVTCFFLAISCFAISAWIGLKAQRAKMMVAFNSIGVIICIVMALVYGNIPLITYSVVYEELGSPDIIFFEEGDVASVSVLEFKEDEERYLSINGLIGAETSSNLTDPYQGVGFIADIAMLSHKDPKSMFIAGLGGGLTAGVAGLYKGVDVKVVEIAPTVVNALPHFDPYIYYASKNEDLEIIIGDARHYLNSSKGKYDLINTDVYISASSGTSYLYNEEFFQVCLDHLNPGGRLVMQMSLSSNIDRVITKGFTNIMPFVKYVYIPELGFSYMIGSNEEIVFPKEPWTKWSNNENIMERVHLMGLYNKSSLGDLKVISRDEIVANNHLFPSSKDDKPVVDFIQLMESRASALKW